MRIQLLDLMVDLWHNIAIFIVRAGVVMQLNIDIDSIFAEELKKEFSTPNLKDAIYKLFEFYKNTQKINTQDIEVIEKSDSDYGYIVDAKKRRENGEKTFNLDDVIKEFE